MLQHQQKIIVNKTFKRTSFIAAALALLVSVVFFLLKKLQ